jgi:N-acetylmuramoyl-L-alanine amidase
VHSLKSGIKFRGVPDERGALVGVEPGSLAAVPSRPVLTVCGSRTTRLLGITLIALLLAQAVPSFATDRRELALTQFESAEQLRAELNGRVASERTRRDYLRVAGAYRRVYYLAPNSSKADASIVAVAELLAEAGRAFKEQKLYGDSIGQYQFLRREYPGSKYRISALFAIGQIYKDELHDTAQARAAFEELLQNYPHSKWAASAETALAELSQPGRKQESRQSATLKPEQDLGEAAKPLQTARTERSNSPVASADQALPNKREPVVEAPSAPASSAPQTQPASQSELAASDQPAAQTGGGFTLIAGIRHWSTPESCRVAIDLQTEVKYVVGRVSSPERIYFDLHDARLASDLIGKSTVVQDEYLHKVRMAPYRRGVVRIVLDVTEDADYSAFFLPNPTRLIIDIHPKGTAATTKLAQGDQKSGSTTPGAGLGEHADREIAENTVAQPAKQSGVQDSVGSFSRGRQVPPLVIPSSPGGKPFDTTVAPLKYDVQLSASAAPFAPTVTASDRRGASLDRAPLPEHDKVEAGKTDSADANPKAVRKNRAATLPRASVQTQAGLGTDTEGLKTRRVSKKNGAKPYDAVHEALPTASGDRSLIRALGLKIGKIVIDAGHGGHDTGTVGPDGLMEKDLVLDVALRLGNLLQQKMGADVVYTRTDDTFIPLEERTAIANRAQADLFISIHANSSSDPAARGIETYYLNFTSSPDALEVAARENAVSETSIHELQDMVKKIALKEKIEESREFASDVQKSLWSGVAAKSPAVRNRGVKKAPFVVLIGANMPSVLAEISFLSNPVDERKLETSQYRDKIAEYLYRGIARYVSGLSGVKMATRGSVADASEKPIGATAVQVKASAR